MTKSKILDTVGMTAATICLIHCIAFPVLITLSSTIAHSAYVDLAFLPIAVIVVYRVTKEISSGLLTSLFWVSVALIAVSVAADLIYEQHLPFIYVGALGLITAHIVNFKKHQH